MTALAGKSDGVLGTPAGSVPRRTNPRRRSPAMASLGVALVAIGALAAWQYVSVAGTGTRSYLAVDRPVAIGAQITADDVQIVDITPVPGLTPVPASDLSEVIGKYAKVDLVAGTLLASAELANSNVPPPDQALLGLLLTPAQRPGRPLRPGDHVRLVALPDPASTDQSGTGLPPPLPATVHDVFAPDADGAVVVDVLVAVADARSVASFGNAGRISVLLVSED